MSLPHRGDDAWNATTLREALVVDRYARHRLISWWDQKAIASAAVVVVGCGALGSEVAKLLALIGIGTIILVDPDRVELHNLTRGVLFRSGDVGRLKAAVSARRVRALNPDVHVEPIVGRVETHLGLGRLSEVDIVIGCVDSVGARMALNRMCRRVGVAWINGGISPTAGEVAVYGVGATPCYACGASPDMLSRAMLSYTCRGFRAPDYTEPAPTTATVASAIAAMQVQQALVRICRHASAPDGLRDGQKAYLSLSPPAFLVTTLPERANCEAHERWMADLRLEGSPESLTSQDVLVAARYESGVVHLDHEVLSEVRYACCGASRRVLRPLRSCGEEVLRCPRCGEDSGEPRIATSVGGNDRLARVRLSRLGVPPRQILRVASADGAAVRYVEIGPTG